MEAGKTWKERGNALFQQQKYDEAVDAYTKAIDADSRVSVYYSNRALCHLRLKNYKHVLQDCAKAIERDSISYKAFYYQGQARVGLRDYRLAVESFKKSYDLVPERDSSIALEIWDLIHRASRKQFETAYASQESRRQNAKKGIIEALHTAQARELSEANSTDKKEEIRKNYKFLFDEIEKRFQPLKLTTSMVIQNMYIPIVLKDLHCLAPKQFKKSTQLHIVAGEQ
eukprot:TRINITY_DN2995_c0_g1_i4.p1 TRINITY_DN2995_c0_g1~~TRINITY_DN2995_c0_g1_i4.p1  ORF type:complete len:227 (+),score=44.87 TRINITY_DN2995_c0_g1_i4:44-724(+)